MKRDEDWLKTFAQYCTVVQFDSVSVFQIFWTTKALETSNLIDYMS